MLGEEVGGLWSGVKMALFPFDQIFQNTLYIQNIFAKSFKIFCWEEEG